MKSILRMAKEDPQFRQSLIEKLGNAVEEYIPGSIDPRDLDLLLKKVKWSVKTWGKPVRLGPGVSIQMEEMEDSPSLLGLTIIIARRKQTRPLAKNHVETRGRSAWFRDNVWTLSREGISFFSSNIEMVLNQVDQRLARGDKIPKSNI